MYESFQRGLVSVALKRMSFRKKMEYWVLAFILLGLGLSVPKISQLLVYVVFFILLLNWRKKIDRDFVLQSYFLIAFSVTYYMFLLVYGFTNAAYVIHRPLLFLGFYALGYSVDRSNVPNWPYGVALLLLVAISGLVIFTFLCLYLIPHNRLIITAATRMVDSFWGSGEAINATIVGLFASLGLCLAPVAIFGKDRNIKTGYYLVLAGIILFFGAIGLYAAIILQTRSPILAAGISLAFSTLLYVFSKDEKGGITQRKITKMFIIIFFCAEVALLMAPYIPDVNFSTIFKRLAAKGLETTRYSAWADLIEGLPMHLLGGRHIYLGGVNYVHNLWLDIAFDAGVIPLFFLILFHLFHFKSYLSIATTKLPLFVKTVVSSVGVSFWVGFMVEPALSGSVIYFAVSCFYLGAIRRLARDIKSVPDSACECAYTPFSLDKADMQSAQPE